MLLNPEAHEIAKNFWEAVRTIPLLCAIRIEPHNPRTTPAKTMINIASAVLGVVHLLLLSLALTLRAPPPQKTSFRSEAPSDTKYLLTKNYSEIFLKIYEFQTQFLEKVLLSRRFWRCEPLQKLQKIIPWNNFVSEGIHLPSWKPCT